VGGREGKKRGGAPKARRRAEKKEGKPVNNIRDGWRERGREDWERKKEEEKEGGG
jgi:hypothetical protein